MKQLGVKKELDQIETRLRRRREIPFQESPFSPSIKTRKGPLLPEMITDLSPKRRPLYSRFFVLTACPQAARVPYSVISHMAHGAVGVPRPAAPHLALRRVTSTDGA